MVKSLLSKIRQFSPIVSSVGGVSRRRVRSDRGDLVTNAIVGIVLLVVVIGAGIGIYSLLNRGDQVVAQQTQEHIRADIVSVYGQRPSVSTSSPVASTAEIVSALNAAVSGGNRTYYPLIASDTHSLAGSPLNLQTGSTPEQLHPFSIGLAEPNKEFWVFAPNVATFVCAADPYVETSSTDDTDAGGGEPRSGQTRAGTALGANVNIDTSINMNDAQASLCNEDGDDEQIDVRRNKTVYVGGITETGSHFCVKYAVGQQAVDTNGFSYWHVDRHPVGLGTAAEGALADIQADCGAHDLLARLTNGAAYGVGAGETITVIPHEFVAPGLCGHASSLSSPQEIPACQD